MDYVNKNIYINTSKIQIACTLEDGLISNIECVRRLHSMHCRFYGNLGKLVLHVCNN